MPRCTAIVPFIPGGKDVLATAQFYIHHLGFQQGWDDGATPPQNLELHRDAISFVLYQTDNRLLSEWSTFRIEVQDVEGLYNHLKATAPEAIHRNGALGIRPWGATEFAVLDPTGVCITFYEFPKAE
ncbi:MAG: VOC family protein [Chlorobi bacterium]|nr:VOC family protein [Chlorobiota bacterium]